jgi:hypothetical protein
LAKHGIFGTVCQLAKKESKTEWNGKNGLPSTDITHQPIDSVASLFKSISGTAFPVSDT